MTTVLREWISEEDAVVDAVHGGIGGGGGGGGGESYWTTERGLSCVAGIAIGANAFKEWRQWREDATNVAVSG